MDEAVADVRYDIFRENLGFRVTGALIAERGGVLSGIQRAREDMEALGLAFVSRLVDGDHVRAGQEIARVMGNPVQTAMAEERIIGSLSKSSGIATAAREVSARMGPSCRVVSGGWKKMPLEIKELVRKAVRDGGLQARISDVPFIYLDKNYVRILGGVKESVHKVFPLRKPVVIQIRGETKAIGEEAIEAVQEGASVVMVDTGKREDLEKTIKALRDRGLRERVRIAFAGEITMEQLEGLAQMDLDMVDMGYGILDAPCLPMRFDVIEVKRDKK